MAPLDFASQRVRHVVARRSRARRYGRGVASPQLCEFAGALARDGYAVLPGVLEVEAVDRVRLEAEAAVCAGRLALPSRSVPSQAELEAFRRTAAEGEAALARAHAMVYVEDPLVNCPSALSLVVAPPLLDVAALYYGCPAAVVAPKVVKTYANDVPSTVHHFHVDYGHVKYLKFFIYLNDVDDEGGPFCFVAGSHRHKPRGWRRHPFEWSEDEIRAYYGAGAIRLLTARRGDLIVADTRGFHRGVKPRARNRMMLRGAIGVRRPAGGLAPLPSEQLKRLSERQRAATDYLAAV